MEDEVGVREEPSENGNRCLISVKKEMGKGKRKFWERMRAQAANRLRKVETYRHLGLCHQKCC